MWVFLMLSMAMAQESMVTAQAIINRQLNSEVSVEDLEHAAILGMVQTVEEQTGLSGSTVLTEKEYEQEKSWKEGKREGYGVRVQLIPRQGFFVDSVIENSPADKAGIQNSDIIVSFAGHSLVGLPPEAMLYILNQDYPKAITVGFVRNGSAQQVSVQKGFFQMEMLSVVSENIIGIHFFGKSVCGEFEAVVEEQADQPLVLDLRDNEGGLWEESIACLDLFLERNAVLGYRQMVDGTSIPILSQRNMQHVAPVVVLVNQGTKGPAELFALVLQEYGRAELVGERTHGNAVDYQYYPIDERWLLKLADTELLSANKVSWRNNGITPNFSVPLHADIPTYTGVKQIDMQLETAIRLLSSD
jgi:carboxyl-terminal processing protease